MPPPTFYSSVNEDNKKLTDLPHGEKIRSLCIAATCLLPCYFIVTGIAVYLLFTTCVPTERLVPCEFKGRMKLSGIYFLKNEINDTQKKINEITNVMQYGVSAESSKRLLQKQNSINETLQALKQKYDNQKIHFEKCYYNNFENNHNNRRVFLQISSIPLLFIIISLFAAIHYYRQKIPLAELNSEEIVVYKNNNVCLICCFGTLFVIVFVFIALLFIPGVYEMKEPEDIPIFVAESWKNFCHRMPTINVEAFLSSEDYKNNYAYF